MTVGESAEAVVEPCTCEGRCFGGGYPEAKETGCVYGVAAVGALEGAAG